MCLQFYNKKRYHKSIAKSPPSGNNKSYYVFSVFFQNLLSQWVNIEENPGPKYSSLSFFPLNLNGLTAHDCIKITLIQACITDQNFDIVCLSQTFLSSSIQNDDHKLKIDGYNLVRPDHPTDSKKGGIGIYYKEHIPLIRRDDLCTLDNCLITEIPLQSKKCFLTCVYRSPSQI